MGTALADFRSSGTIPCIKDKFITCLNGQAMMDALSLTKRAGIPSKPVVFLAPSLPRHFKILFSDTMENE